MDPIPPHSYVVVPRGSNEATNEPDGWVRDSSQSLLNTHTIVRYHDTTIPRYYERTEPRKGEETFRDVSQSVLNAHISTVVRAP